MISEIGTCDKLLIWRRKMKITNQKIISKFLFVMMISTIFFSNICLATGMEKDYYGAPLSREKTAVIFLDDIQILSINGIVKNYWNSACEFLPGKYKCLVRYLELSPTASSKPAEIDFIVEAGHNYVLTGIYETKGNFFSKGVYFTPHIEDISSQKYDPDSSKLSAKKVKKFDKKILKSKLKQIKAYEKLITKLGSFEPLKLSFYEFNGSTIPKNIKANTSFDLSLTRYIIAELKARNTILNLEDQRHTLRWRYYYPRQMTKDGKWMNAFEVCDFTSEMVIKSSQEFSFPYVSWGKKEYGWIWGKENGKKGTYAVTVYLNDIEIIDGRFIIH